MTTIAKAPNKLRNRNRTNLKKVNLKPAASLADAATETKPVAFKDLPENLIDFSPFNYRRTYPEAQLKELATGIAQVGILHPVKVRPCKGGRFELIIGEGRLRASRLAGLQLIAATVGNYSDEEVREMQLQENLQRTNPHPLDEAIAILQMQDSGKTVKEIAGRLGKSERFVFVRIRIAALIEPLKAVYAGDKMTLQDAWELAALTAESQQEFFEAYYKGWMEPNFRQTNVRYNLQRFTYNLKEAPFNTKDKKLIPEAGACTNCPFNSAVLKSLFPEMAKEAVCQNKACYNSKCQKTTEINIVKVVAELQPDAIVHRWGLSETEKIVLDSLPETGGIPQHCIYDITILSAPLPPDKEEYQEYSGEEEEDTPAFDEESYAEAVKDYEAELTNYQAGIISGKYQKGLLLQSGKAEAVYFLPQKPKSSHNSSGGITAKEVQEAIKAGTATVELLEQEKERLQSRETRSLEIDRDKVQLAIHEQFLTGEQDQTHKQQLTAADTIAIRLIIYQSLDYSVRHKVNALFNDCKLSDPATFYHALSSLTEEQFAFMIRIAIAGNSESKLPGHITGYTLYQMAEQAGTHVVAIEAAQTDIAEARAKKLAEKLAAVEQKISVLQA